MDSSSNVDTKTAPQKTSSAGQPPSLGDRVWKILKADRHRAYATEDLVKLLKMQAPKDPQKQAQAVEQVADEIRKLIETDEVTEVVEGIFKARVFFDAERNIEHVFIGGMGNTDFRFSSPIFRMNLGVLSVFCIRDKKAGDWMITVKDTTIGRDYCLTRRIRDGVYLFGNRGPKEGEKNYLQIAGLYISQDHGALTLSGEDVVVKDHHTVEGTRLDILTKEGMGRYGEAARAFIKGTDKKGLMDGVARGRFALVQLIQHHKNFETSFFNAVVDSLLIEGN